jgi:hypothetical protein
MTMMAKNIYIGEWGLGHTLRRKGSWWSPPDRLASAQAAWDALPPAQGWYPGMTAAETAAAWQADAAEFASLTAAGAIFVPDSGPSATAQLGAGLSPAGW